MQNDSQHRIDRIVQQQLESLQRAGITHVPRYSEPVVSAVVETEESPQTSPPAGETGSTSDAPSRVMSRTLIDNEETATAGRIPVTKNEHSTLSATEKTSQLNILADSVAACTRCETLAAGRTNTVFGVGDVSARLLFIGEGPGAEEDKQGEPFVGRAGKLLTQIIEACTLKREEVYICNVVKCRPPENRNPTPDEATNCKEFLDGQLAIVDPDYIVCLGAVAAQNLLETTVPIGKLRGKFHDHGRAQVLCTYHPSYLLRNPPAKKEVWADMKFLMRAMGVELD